MPNASTSIPILLRAIAFAAEKHRHQRRKDVHASPYINHPIELAQLLANEGGVSDVDVLCAAALHDTIEDTNTTAAELRREFGDVIASIVGEVTDDKALAKTERKRLQVEHAARLSREAKLVKLADKICNVRDILAAPPAGWNAARRHEYVDWAVAVVDGMRGVHPALEAMFDAIVARRNEIES